MIAPDDGVYVGPADLVVGDERHPVRTQLKGYLNTFDGHYHWQGTVYEVPADVQVGKPVLLRVGDRDAAARLVEHAAGGGLMISGTGRPPFWP